MCRHVHLSVRWTFSTSDMCRQVHLSVRWTISTSNACGQVHLNVRWTISTSNVCRQVHLSVRWTIPPPPPSFQPLINLYLSMMHFRGENGPPFIEIYKVKNSKANFVFLLDVSLSHETAVPHFTGLRAAIYKTRTKCRN